MRTIRFGAILLTCLMLLGNMPSSAEKAADDGLPVITMLAARVNSDHFDGDLVAKAFDEYASPLIGAHVLLEYESMDYLMRTLDKRALDGCLPDLFLIMNPDQISNLRRSGCLMPLNHLMEQHAPSLAELCGEDAILAQTVNGQCYAIPCIHDRASALALEYRVRYAEQYHLDMEHIYSIHDLTSVFEVLAEQAPDVLPLERYVHTTWDSMGDSLGVLMDFGQSDKVVNLFETEAFAEQCRLFSTWRKKGYLLDTDYRSSVINGFVAYDDIFGKLASYDPRMQYMDEEAAGEKIACVRFGEAVMLSGAYRNNVWAISSNSAHPDIAMRLMNLLYTDPVAVNLLAYGIEGVHYRFTDRENGIIAFPEGVTRETSGYVQFRSYLCGNEFLCYTWENYPTNMWEQVRRFNDSAMRSHAFGFTWDPAPVADQVRACQAVVNQYAPVLQYGAQDVDAVLAQFIGRLKEEGIDEIVAEKQRQFDIWREQSGD